MASIRATDLTKYNAGHPRQPPNLRLALRDAYESRTALLGTWLGIPSQHVAGIVASTATDFVVVDGEHTPNSATLISDTIQTLRAHSGNQILPLVRLPAHTHDWAAWALDAGACGIIMPHTETVEQVRDLIDYVKFPPYGKRSFPPYVLLPIDNQKADTNGMNVFETANEHIAVIPQIESKLGVENAEAILQMAGIDAIMIGQTDLRLDVGGSFEVAAQYIARLEDVALKYKKPILSIVEAKDIPAKMERGYTMLLVAADVPALALGLQSSLEKARTRASTKL
ncbi:Phosphoenolpyruvate/pyruvate domain-containing protein [Cylindrobasidium torrendii FP15055 ss-10]|uniref:Phosphoenolpyruvate/pyruvate domain-containing protein n=1 Tax=Cylindrobasidium torrendii FP15055 ss-10 TaxID=1314674 RepID=A0A0D7B4K5_9AGAR|nr:Phosphoenolpyruvate/pyruvate domain-containing protein [Cylindrobasidium torrendii FP15055 ss-10]